MSLVCLCLVSEASAEAEESGTVEEMVVSASRSPRTRASIPSFTSMLDGEDLESGVSLSVTDALRFVPGLQVVQDGARGGRASLYLRGLDPNHVVVMIDGVRLNDPTNQRGGSFDPTTLALVDIDRVEIIKGPLSAIYGSDALAGVINIITKSVAPDADPTGRATARGGRFHEGSFTAHGSGGIGDIAGLSLGAAYDTSRDPNSSGGYDGISWKSKLDVELPLELDFEAFTRMHWSSSESFPESSGGPERAQIRSLDDRDVREILFGAALKREFGESADVVFRFSNASRREENDSPGIAGGVPPNKTDNDYDRWDVGLSASGSLLKFELAGVAVETRVVAGVDYVDEDGESDNFLDFGFGPTPFPFDEDRKTWGFFGEVEEKIGPHVVVSANLRYDSTSDERDRFSPGAGITIDIPRTPVTLFGSYGEGFKRPSFYALGDPLVGDPNLDPEESRGWEVGLRASSRDGHLRGQMSYFDIEVKDLIDFDAASFSLVNRGRLISRGVEIETSWQARDWVHFLGSVTFNPTDFEGTSLQPENRPKWRGFGELRLGPVHDVDFKLRVLAVGSSKASSFATGARQITLAGYERIDVRIGWTPRDWVELFFEIQNLSDRTYREAVGFESPGIAPRIGLTLRR